MNKYQESLYKILSNLNLSSTEKLEKEFENLQYLVDKEKPQKAIKIIKKNY